jgi:hypothetical protein
MGGTREVVEVAVWSIVLRRHLKLAMRLEARVKIGLMVVAACAWLSE